MVFASFSLEWTLADSHISVLNGKNIARFGGAEPCWQAQPCFSGAVGRVAGFLSWETSILWGVKRFGSDFNAK